VIAGQVNSAPGEAQVAVHLVLHDVAQQRTMNNKEYSGVREQHRQIAHRFIDVIFREFTGEDGPFDTQVVCVTPGKSGRQGKDIVLMDYDGYGAQSLVADGGLNLAPTLSPNGAMLAYTSYRNGAPSVYVRNVATNQDERITSGPGLALAGSWSPDSRYLALNYTVDGNSDIYLYDVRSKRLTRLTQDWGIDVSPSFAPDGRRLVFTSDRGGSPQLYLTDVQGSPAVRLTYEGRYNSAPSWSPRGDTIAFVGRSSERSLAVYTIRANGSRQQRLSNGGGFPESPSWAPNGRFVMYTSMQGGAWQRYMTREDGQGHHPLPAGGPTCLALQWVARVAR
jgi:TolB protein